MNNLSSNSLFKLVAETFKPTKTKSAIIFFYLGFYFIFTLCAYFKIIPTEDYFYLLALSFLFFCLLPIFSLLRKALNQKGFF